MFQRTQRPDADEPLEGEVIDSTLATRGQRSGGGSKTSSRILPSSGLTAKLLLLAVLPLLALAGLLVVLGWVSELVLPLLIRVITPLLTLTILILLPLTHIKTTRYRAGTWMYLGSFVYALAAWMLGFLITLEYWGVFAVILGLVLLGIGVVPLGIAAALVHADWTALLGITGLSLTAWGSRYIALRALAK